MWQGRGSKSSVIRAVRNGQYYLTKARFESSCDMPRVISFLRTRISTTKTLHATAMLTKLNNVATTCVKYCSRGDVGDQCTGTAVGSRPGWCEKGCAWCVLVQVQNNVPRRALETDTK